MLKLVLALVFPNLILFSSGMNIPSLNVTTPTETLPVKVASTAVISPSIGPTNFVAVIIPEEFML